MYPIVQSSSPPVLQSSIPPPRKLSQKDESLKFREYNLFSKKVPQEAEAANIQVKTI